MAKALLTLLLFIAAAAARAQLTANPQPLLTAVVGNAETGVPMREVAIYTNTGKTYTTNWRGEAAIMSPFKSATIVKADFVSLTLDFSEMSDTIWLLPRFNTLSEVVVWGKGRMINKHATRSWEPSFLPAPTGGIGGLDILGLFTRKRAMNKRQVEKHKEVMREY